MSTKKTTAVNKFTTNLQLSNKEIKDKRAVMICEDAEESQIELVAEIKKRKRTLEKELMDLEDMSASSADSLHPGKKGFVASEWTKSIQGVKVALRMIEVELEIANETTNEYFNAE